LKDSNSDSDDEVEDTPHGPQTNEEVDELVYKQRREKRKTKKGLKKQAPKQIVQAKSTANKSSAPAVRRTGPMSHEQVGMIRYSAMARVHIGEVRNPKIGELPSRTPSLPEKRTVSSDVLSIPSVSDAKKLVSKLWSDETSSDEEDDDAEEEEEEEEEEEGEEEKDGEDDSLLGAIREGVGVITSMVEPIMKSKASEYVELNDNRDVESGKGTTIKSRKGKKKKKKKKEKGEAVKNRPLEVVELEEGKRLREVTPLSLRYRQYQAIFNREADCCGEFHALVS
jgi:hypothetical protein